MLQFSKLAVLSSFSVLLVTGCGGNNLTSVGSSSQIHADATTPKAGVGQMLGLTNQLEQQIRAGNESQVKVTGPKLETVWRTFEDRIHSKYPDDYASVEKYLDPTVAGSKASTLDKGTLGKLNTALTEVLQKLDTKLK